MKLAVELGASFRRKQVYQQIAKTQSTNRPSAVVSDSWQKLEIFGKSHEAPSPSSVKLTMKTTVLCSVLYTCSPHNGSSPQAADRVAPFFHIPQRVRHIADQLRLQCR